MIFACGKTFNDILADMTKRLFVSIAIPKEWQEIFTEYHEQFSARDARWTPKENIHITACFLGDVDEAHIVDIQERIKNVCAHTESFSLTFEKMSFAPPRMPPRMVWAVFHESAAYVQLVKGMQEALRSFLAVEPHEEKIPHATLARFNNPALAKEIDITKAQPEPMPFDVRSVELMESRLDPAGVRYEKLETFLFGMSA